MVLGDNVKLGIQVGAVLMQACLVYAACSPVHNLVFCFIFFPLGAIPGNSQDLFLVLHLSVTHGRFRGNVSGAEY